MSQRKNYFIERGMQSKFIVTLMLLIFLVAVITVCNVYVIYEYVQSNNLGGTAMTKPFFSVAFDLMGYRLFLIGLVNIIIVAIIGVFYSHQFAGPSYKIEKSIRQIAQGDLSFHVTLRKSDTMHNIAESLNQMVDNFRSVLKKAADITAQIKETSARIPTDDEQTSRNIATLKGIAGELEDLLAGFRLLPGERPPADLEASHETKAE